MNRVLVALICIFLNTTYIYANEPEQEMRKVYLKAPDLSDAQILGYNVGIRPFRSSGIRIEPEYLRDKLVIHNYGYGGSGLTLCWGGADQVIKIMEQEKVKNTSLSGCTTIAVLGSGVIGLATAYDLLEKGYKVHIYAKDFPPNVTSNVAEGVWSPPGRDGNESVETKNRLTNMLAVSKQRFLNSATENSPEFIGVRFIDDYSFKHGSQTSAILSGPFGFAHPEQGQLVEVYFDNGVKKMGKYRRNLSIDGGLFMQDLVNKVKAKGAVFEQRAFKSRSEIEMLAEQIIINCTSLGSRELFNDNDFIPIRGHLVYLKFQEGINYMVHQNVLKRANYWSTIYPWHDRLIVSGVFENGQENCAIDQAVVDALIEHARDSFGPQ